MYLVQRCSIKSKLYLKMPVLNIYKILNFEYMGSAEFEFGTLPRSLKKIFRDLDKFEIKQTQFSNNGKKLYIFAKKGEHKKIEEDLEDLLTNPRYRTKEWTNIPEALGFKEPIGKCTTDFWWCVDNSSFGTNNDNSDWMMFLSNKAFLKVFKKAIRAEA